MDLHLFLVVLGLFVLLFIASLLVPVARRLNFPFTVLLAAAGVVLGIVVLVIPDKSSAGIAGDFLHAVENLDITSEAVFFLFLPALIFESSMSINVRHLMKDIKPILMLAVIGLLISTFAVGFAMEWVSGIGFVACLLLGAIVSATDPVAVVAIFKDLGAPKRLTILVEGESLFNDATAIVLFIILAAVMVGTAEASAGSAAVDFIKVFFGGIAVGLVAARSMAWIIGTMRNMPLVEVTLTVVLAYLSFLIAEHYLHVSGVMAVVTAGLVMGSYGRTKVSPATWHALHETWEQLGFWANSLIFFLVGILVPNVLKDFTGEQAIWLVVLVAVAFAARAAVLFGVLPLMIRAKLSANVSGAFKTIMFWGGLRGAVSLALALVIFETDGVDQEVKNFIVVLVTCFVLITLFINATTIRFVMAMFGLDKLSAADIAVRDRVMALSLSRIQSEIHDVAEAQQVAPKLAGEISDDYTKRLNALEHQMANTAELDEADRVKIGLGTLVNREREIYLKRFSDGVASDDITRALIAATDMLEDGMKAEGVGGYEEAATQKLGFDLGFRTAMYLQRKLGLTGALQGQLAGRFEVLIANQSALRQLLSVITKSMEGLLGGAAAERLEEILRARAAATDQALDALKLQYPDYFDAVQRSHLGRVAVRLEDLDYRRMLAEQLISPEVYNNLVQELDWRARDFEAMPELDLGLQPEIMVAKVPFFADLDRARIRQIAALLRPRLVLPGEKVVKKGEAGDAMYFVSTGALEVDIGETPIRLGSGDFFGEIALVRDAPRNADVTALSYCQMLHLSAREFRTLMESQPDLKSTIERVVAERLGTDGGK
ncbi:MAG: cyclic nucleotide-binding domain-containing protein [Rhodospirillaceae bacterium]|nr:cyclic nucleotide-binding domain-containing protein [Rhodospirillaceae bacterium]